MRKVNLFSTYAVLAIVTAGAFFSNSAPIGLVTGLILLTMLSVRSQDRAAFVEDIGMVGICGHVITGIANVVFLLTTAGYAAFAIAGVSGVSGVPLGLVLIGATLAYVIGIPCLLIGRAKTSKGHLDE